MKNNNRRDFLKVSSLALAGAALGAYDLPFSQSSYPTKRLGLQLWSVRDAMVPDPAGTVKALGKMGYRNVEGFGYKDGKIFGLALKDFGKLLKDNGMKMPSCHHMVTLADWNGGTKSLSDSFRKAVDDMASVGQKYVIAPWMAEEDRPKIAELIKVYNAAGEYCKKAGMRFGYHNHNFEYEQKAPDGRLLAEWLAKETDPALVTLEMDVYWVKYAKHDPAEWMNKYPGRWELLHVKDMANTEKKESVEVGDGSINFSELFKNSSKAGVKYYIIELEHYRTTSMQGVEKSFKGFTAIK